MSKEAYYFSHDANARNDPKILAMRSEYGIKGYGMYWVIIEMLREQENFKLPLKKYIWSAIAMQTDANAMQNNAKDYAKKFVESCINDFDLFEADEDFFWSNSLIKRMDQKNKISEKRRAAAKARWDKPSNINDSGDSGENEEMQNDANAMQNNANAMQVDAIKGKEIKIKEKENINTTQKDVVQKFSISDMENAKYLFGLMQQNNPGAKQPDFDKWADTFRLMRERDERTDEQIKYLISWSQQDEFWHTNILSPATLRKQWDKLVLKAKKDHQATQQLQTVNGPVDLGRLEAILEDE